MTHEPAHAPLDQTDPHHELHHAHVIVQPRTLIVVLTVLLIFTVLTVAASRGEVWVAHTFQFEVPQMVNVGVVLFIAVIKSALVAMYFMQLRYDNILNTIIFLFCLFALGLFLFFSMTDLGQRDTLYNWKSGEIQKGGMGITTRRELTPGGRVVGIDTGTTPIVQWAKEQRKVALGEKFGAAAEAQYAREHALFAEHKEDLTTLTPLSSPNRSIPRTGQTPDLYKPREAPAEHGAPHGH